MEESSSADKQSESDDCEPKSEDTSGAKDESGSDESSKKEEKPVGEKETKSRKDESSASANGTSSSSTSLSDDESESTEPSKAPENKTEQKDKDDTTDDSDIEDDLISAINYNTITSLAALKDMLQSSGEDSSGVDSFFHHYFLSHVNRLPSRNQTHSPYPWGRRLSECREEDEYETEEGALFFFLYTERQFRLFL